MSVEIIWITSGMRARLTSWLPTRDIRSMEQPLVGQDAFSSRILKISGIRVSADI
jgi:hypothetical protein